MTGEKLELGLQREPQALERPTGGKRQASKCSFQLTGGLGEHRLEEAALRVVVVEQQLLVDARPSRDLLDARARKASPGKLLARRHWASVRLRRGRPTHAQIVPVQDRVEHEGEAPLRLPAPERTNREQHDVSLSDRRIEYRWAPSQLLSVDEQTGQPQRVSLLMKAQHDPRPRSRLLGGKARILILGNVGAGIHLE